MSRGIDAQPSRKQILDALNAAVEDRFGSVEGYLKKEVFFDEDFPRDEVAAVRIVFDPKKFALKSDEMRSVGRFLRGKLAEIGSNTFPLVKYLSNADYERIRPETGRSS